MSQETHKTPYLVVLKNGETFTTKAHTVSKNRYFDGVDFLYFETIESHEPTVAGAKFYHKWNFTDYWLSAWLVPTSEVTEVIDQSL
jgi:hypothetical protein